MATKNKAKRQSNEFMRVPNNEEGRTLITIMKKYLNNTSYRLIVKGRKIDPQYALTHPDNAKYMSGVGSIPLNLATELGIYIGVKRTHYFDGSKFQDVITVGLNSVIWIEHLLQSDAQRCANKKKIVKEISELLNLL